MVRIVAGFCILVSIAAVSAGQGRWGYTYEDDFSTQKAKNDCYESSLFWPEDAGPAGEPYLFYTVNTQPPGGLGFAGDGRLPAYLIYCFPVDGTPPSDLTGLVELDVYDAGGAFVVYKSGNGVDWTRGEVVPFGHNRLPIASDEGTCYVWFEAYGVVIDNLQVKIIERADHFCIDDDAPNDPGPGDPTISDPLEDGTLDHPFDSIQEAIDLLQGGGEIVVADGTYTGQGNKNIDFCQKSIRLRSANGPVNCVIDCEGDGRGFYLVDAPQNSLICGFTIQHGGGVSRGAGIYCFGGDPKIFNCAIAYNTATGTSESAYGGGIYCEQTAPLLMNCVLAYNQAVDGGGLPSYGGAVYLKNKSNYSPTIINCAVAGNAAVSDYGAYGGGLYTCEDPGGWGTQLMIANSIVWANQPQQLYADTSTTILATYSDVQGGWPGDGNIDADPQFVEPTDPRLQSISPCIDAGNNKVVPIDYADLDGDDIVIWQKTPLDIYGQDRFVNDPATPDTGLADPPDYPDVVDMGPCEYQPPACPGDIDGDGMTGLSDLAALLGAYLSSTGDPNYDPNADFDGSGSVDLADLAFLLSDYNCQ